jgi:hypothetical protein
MFFQDPVARNLIRRCLQVLLKVESSLEMLIHRLEAAAEARSMAGRCPLQYLACSDSQFLRIRKFSSKSG